MKNFNAIISNSRAIICYTMRSLANFNIRVFWPPTTKSTTAFMYWLHATADSFDTFLYAPSTCTSSGSHVRDCVDLKRWMIIPVIAMIPAVLFGMWNIGYQHFVALGQHVGFWPIVWFGFL